MKNFEWEALDRNKIHLKLWDNSQLGRNFIDIRFIFADITKYFRHSHLDITSSKEYCLKIYFM